MNTSKQVYLALGDSMSIDDYTGVKGGGAVTQFLASLGPGWSVDDRTVDGCLMEEVPLDGTGDLITMTIGGNNLLVEQSEIVTDGLVSFATRHRQLLKQIRSANPNALFVVGNVYEPQTALPQTLLTLLRKANSIIATNAAEVGAQLADIHGTFRGNESTYLTQVIEPSLEGAKQIAELFSAAR